MIQVNGYGDPIGNHRNTDPLTGRDANLNAVAHKTYFGRVPQTVIEVSNPSGDIHNLNCPVTVEGYYDARGVRSDSPFRGLNIVRYSNGSVRKLFR